MRRPAPIAQTGTEPNRGTATIWRARPMNTSAHQCTWRRSKFRRLPPAITPARIARPITARIGDMRVWCPAASSTSRYVIRTNVGTLQEMEGSGADLGYFGPGSVSWQVDREVTVLFGHATLVDSALLYEELTIGRLDDVGRQRFHEEQMLAAELVRIPKESIPPTVPALRAWLADVEDRGELAVTDGARRVAGLFMDPPRDAEWRPILPQVARLAFGTLSPHLREMYGIRWNTAKEAALRSTFALMRAAGPLLPAKYRYIEPYNDWVRQGRRTPTLRPARPRG